MIKVLYVEDSPTQALAVTSHFSSYPHGIEIQSVPTGSECIARLEGTNFSLILLDYVLPDMSGLEVLSRIRNLGNEIPVIMVTGQGDEQIAVEAMKAGASDYVTKTSDFIKILPLVIQQTLEKESLKIRLSETEARSRVFHQVSLDISLELNLERLAHLMAEGMRRLTKADKAVVLLQDSKSGDPEVLIGEGLKSGQIKLADQLRELGIWDPLKTAQTPLRIPSVKGKTKKDPGNPRLKELREVLIIPLFTQEKIIGRLLVGGPIGRDTFSEEDLDVFLNLGVFSSTAIENARYVKRTERLAVTDSLTGLNNHMEFQNRLDQEIERFERYGRHLSVVLMDIDHFKSINDTYGHPLGDEVLKDISQRIKSCLRSVDIPARYGGEEFSVILPETSLDNALLVAERIRSLVGDTLFKTQTTDVRVTVSIGVAGTVDFPDRTSLVAAADKALYIAKETGRNRVCRLDHELKNIVERDNIPVDVLQSELLKQLASSAEKRNPFMRDHSVRVAALAKKLACGMGFSEDEAEGLRQAALLHDIGTAKIPGKILNKKEALTEEEQRIIRAHPEIAEMILKESRQLDKILPAVLYHHERYDGKGYPSGLKGRDIPRPAQILAVADTYEAMISDRSYRKAVSPSKALEEIQKLSGTKFDPEVVEAFISVLEVPGKP